MKRKYFLLTLCIALLLTGCASLSSLSGEEDNSWTDSGFITVGKNLTIQNTDDRLTLLNNMDTLSAEGLYYAAWSIGSSEPYENSEGNTVDLYDAQIYLLMREHTNPEKAQNTLDEWLNAGKTNYNISGEEIIDCNGQSYSLITYTFVNEDNPYDRGISAFGICGKNALCIELTCQEDFDMDLRDIMIHFLESCTYNN